MFVKYCLDQNTKFLFKDLISLRRRMTGKQEKKATKVLKALNN